jgi:Xaa-Pro aminopeptidase
MHDAMKEIADRLTGMMRPGITCNTLYERALAFSEACGMGPYFMRLGTNSLRVPFIGHGVGIELNEPPLLGRNSQDVLEEGMVLTLELEMCAAPGELVKLEDMLHITSGGVEFLTVTPRELHRI